jgi:hypothetical protein
MTAMVRLVLTILALGLASGLAGAEEIGGIDPNLAARAWQGRYTLSSGHSGEIRVDLGRARKFFLLLPDEETAFQYSGEVNEVKAPDGDKGRGHWIIRAALSEEKKKGLDMNTGKKVDSTTAITAPFEVVLSGSWLKATPGPQEMIEGEIRFQGSAACAKWFLDKTGKFALKRGYSDDISEAKGWW